MKITKGDVITVLITIIVVACILMVIKPTIVRGPSMENTLKDGNYLILYKLAYRSAQPEYNDIIVFPGDYEDEELFIKRVIAVGGDTVQISGSDVYRNGEKLDEPYVKEPDYVYEPEENRTWEVPEGYVFAMGDNRGDSHDCRDDSLGFIDQDEIVGKVAVRLFPFNQMGHVD